MAGCAGDGPPPPESTASTSLDSIQRSIFNVHCLSAGCHNATDQQGGLILEAGQSHASLVDVISDNLAAKMEGLRRVVPGDPDQSFLVIKLILPGTNQFGGPMPLGMGQLSSADIERIREWITAGALDSSIPTATASATPSGTDTPTPTDTPTATPSPTHTLTPAPTSSPTVTPTGTRPATPTPTATPTLTQTPPSTATPSQTATSTSVPTPTFSLDSTFPQIQATIFNTGCLDLGCHNTTDRAGLQVLEAGSAYADLVGVTPSYPTEAAQSLQRVDPGNPDNSFLLIKLTLPGVFDVDFGSRMPLSQPPLSAEQIERIRAWILRGALPDETN